jgi:SAM-dependent methyltransferase
LDILRTFYYRLSPEHRFWIRKIYYLPQSIFSKSQELVPPKALIYTGRGDFLQQGRDWQSFFTENGLSAHHRFLDIGSGIGRIALGLTNFLKGPYEGFEAIKTGADWCSQNITPKFPNFNFTFVNLHNDLYNSDGIDAASYTFPYDNDAFDYACAISVFTHMTDVEVDNYLSESARVLTRNGLLTATFFISDQTLNIDSKGTGTTFVFPYEYTHYFLMDKKVKGANVCFKKDYLFDIISKHGFTIEKYIPGSWRGITSAHPLAFQDILVLKKI